MPGFRTRTDGSGKHYPFRETQPASAPVSISPEVTDRIAEEYEREVEKMRTPMQVAQKISSIITDERLPIAERKALISSLSARVGYYSLRRYAGRPEGAIMFESFVRSPII